MKTLFLLLSIFFLNSCACFQDKVPLTWACPFEFQSSKSYYVDFEYGSSKVNDTALNELYQIALQAKEKGQYICFLGQVGYDGNPTDSLQIALNRAQNMADFFLNIGVRGEKIYIEVVPQVENQVLKKPIRATQEVHRLVVHVMDNK